METARLAVLVSNTGRCLALRLRFSGSPPLPMGTLRNPGRLSGAIRWGRRRTSRKCAEAQDGAPDPGPEPRAPFGSRFRLGNPASLSPPLDGFADSRAGPFRLRRDAVQIPLHGCRATNWQGRPPLRTGLRDLPHLPHLKIRVHPRDLRMKFPWTLSTSACRRIIHGSAQRESKDLPCCIPFHDRLVAGTSNGESPARASVERLIRLASRASIPGTVDCFRNRKTTGKE